MAYVIFVVVGLVFLGFIAIGFWLKSERVEVDRVTMCPLDGPSGYTVILIDATDEFTAIQKADLKRYFRNLKAEVPRYSQIAIYAPKEMSDEDFLSPELKLCNPGDAKGISGVTANPARIQKQYEDNFAAKVDEVLDHGLMSEGATTSPVMEMVQAVSVDAFPIDDIMPKRLIIVSDMLQNADWYSHYRDSVEFEGLKSNPGFQHVLTDLSGVQVEILYIRRAGYEHLQNMGHALFWEDVIQYMGGNVVELNPIGG